MESPRVLLICCEGKTERNYFRFINLFYRPVSAEVIEIHHVGRQHKAIIDKALIERKNYAMRLGDGFTEEEIELWIVCDDDHMSIDYSELSKYAIEKGVKVGFSKPNFEAYIIQHFEKLSDNSRMSSIQLKLDKLAGGRYDKTDTSWLEESIYLNPPIVDDAIMNSNCHNSQSNSLFFTVQELTKRLLDIRIK